MPVEGSSSGASGSCSSALPQDCLKVCPNTEIHIPLDECIMGEVVVTENSHPFLHVLMVNSKSCSNHSVLQIESHFPKEE